MIWLLLLFAVLSASADNGGAAFVCLLLAGVGIALRSWRRRRSYPEGRSKAAGATRELRRSAQAKERELLSPELEVHPDGSTENRTKWERVCSDAGLSGANLQRIEATQSGWLYQVELRSGGTVEQAQSAKASLESALKLRRGAVEIEQDEERHAGVVLLRVTPERTVTAKPVPWAGPVPDASILRPAQLGAYQDGGPLSVVLAYQHVLIGGATDAGKSGALNVLVAHVAASPDADLWPIDLKGGVELGSWEQACGLVATTVDQGVEQLYLAQRLLDYRWPIMRARGLRKWVPTPNDPHVVIPVDEVRVLSTSADAVELMEDITGRGRAAAVTLMLSTQYPTVEAIGSSLIVTQCNVRVCLRVNSSREANVILGPGMVGAGWNAHQIPMDQPGTLYLHASGATTPRLARAFHATDAKIEAVAARFAARPRPRLVVPEAATRPALALVPEPDDQDTSGGGEDDLLDHLPGEGSDGIHYRDLMDRTGIPERTLFRRLKKLSDAGLALSDAGHWRRSS